MSTERTIDPQHAADLYEMWDDDGVVQDGTVMDDTTVDHGWLILGSAPSRTSRWHERYWLLLRDDVEGEQVWGIEYGIGLTESQENDLPWENATGPLKLTRLYPHQVTRTEYRTEPAA